MATLSVLDPYAATDAADYIGNIDDATQDHGAVRTVTFTSSTGTFVPGEDVSFSPSGAGGVVVSYASEILSYYLVVPPIPTAAIAVLPNPLILLIASTILEPAVGDSAISESGATAADATAVSHGGDTFVNDGFTDLYVKNDGEQDVHVMIRRARRCNAQHAVTYETRTVFAGKSDRIGPIQKVAFNDEATGLVTVTYVGSLATTDVGVLPILRAPRP